MSLTRKLYYSLVEENEEGEDVEVLHGAILELSHVTWQDTKYNFHVLKRKSSAGTKAKHHETHAS